MMTPEQVAAALYEAERERDKYRAEAHLLNAERDDADAALAEARKDVERLREALREISRHIHEEPMSEPHICSTISNALAHEAKEGA